MSASAEQSYRDTINVFKTTGDIVKQMIEILIQFCEDNKKFKLNILVRRSRLSGVA